MFDQGKTGFIETAKLATIFNTLGQQVDSAELDEACHEFDKGSKFPDKFAFFFGTLGDDVFARNGQNRL